MNGPDHYREAERVMGLAHDSQNQGSWENANIQIQRAQVHATLALAAATIDAPRNGASMGQEFGNWRPVLAPASTTGSTTDAAATNALAAAEDAHTPHSVEEARVTTYESAIELLRTNGRKVQISTEGIGWIPTDTFAGAIRLLEHHRPEQGEKS